VAPILETRGLTKRFGRIRAVQDVDLRVEEGDIYGFLGLNGAGKTTTIRMILQLIRPTAGAVAVFGKEMGRHFIEIMRRVGALVELPAYYPFLSARKNLELLALASGGVPNGRIREVLELVGLAERMDDRVGTYSQGMRQRLAIAMALLARPKLVILDEPTNGLDPHGINHIREAIQRLNREEGVTFVISSHLLHEVEITCNRVGIIKEGKLIVQDTVQNLLASSVSQVRLECEPRDTAEGVLRGLGLKPRTLPDGAFRFYAGRADLPNVTRELVAAGVRVFSLHPERMSLEEFFLSR
jgi:ABC-2 type transport system ATP-binding protein